MQVLTNVVNFFLGLGAPIFVPIIMIIGSILVGMKIKDAISSGITLGVAFTVLYCVFRNLALCIGAE